MEPEAKLFVGILYNEEFIGSVIDILRKQFGDVETESEAYQFDFTDYYQKEMGAKLKKKFVVFKDMIYRKDLAKIKVLTNNIEREYAVNGNRKVNLDPGYMTLHSIILASVKDAPHKIYLSNGIYGDNVLQFRNKEWQSTYNTFPDFREQKVRDFFRELRKNCKESLRG